MWSSDVVAGGGAAATQFGLSRMTEPAAIGRLGIRSRNVFDLLLPETRPTWIMSWMAKPPLAVER
jgi:hypothetical protein